MATATRAESPSEPARWPTAEGVEENLRDVRRAVTQVRHAAEDAAAEAALTIRRHPLRAVGTSAVVGAAIGAVIGFGAGWFARRRW
jgi:ElaB/YqjD/DUF883 family membrane-anchored ribosome-binding protein